VATLPGLQPYHEYHLNDSCQRLPIKRWQPFFIVILAAPPAPSAVMTILSPTIHAADRA
jgi:hypothetical protein